ncbi:MAG TPA: hemerythrin domain-containing protein [Anaeromyxobacteraceae bacterium]|nr:hemerythrin domain-containing protein [Anaeromyxobacteraceae bacterium]
MPNQPSGDRHNKENLPEARDLRAILVRDHARLDALFVQLLDQFRETDPDELRNMWTRFEAGLLAHFVAEERYLLPPFARAEPQEASALVAEHAGFRKTLDALGVGVDLHAVSPDVADDFIEALRAHALREDRLFYKWVEREIQESDRAAVGRDIGDAPRR